MAEGQISVDCLRCSVCLDLLKHPVTIPCGHSYCLDCIQSCWADQGNKGPSCPLCRRRFEERPELVKNTMMAELVRELSAHSNTSKLDRASVGSSSVYCDVCSELTAVKSCLQCLASYCQDHLRPHQQSPAFRKHKLVPPIDNMLQTVCPQHNEVMRIYCCTDQRSICYLCFLDQHRGHDTVPAEEKRREHQNQLNQDLEIKIQGKDDNLKAIKHEIGAFSDSAENVLKEVEKVFGQVVALIQKKSAEVKNSVQTRKKAIVSELKDLNRRLEEEKDVLMNDKTVLKDLSQLHDDAQFLSRSRVISNPDSKPCYIPPQNYFKDVLSSVQLVQEEISDTLMEKCEKILLDLEDIGAFLRPAPTSAELVGHFNTIDLEQSSYVPVVTEENRKVELHGFIAKMISLWGISDQGVSMNKFKVFSAQSLAKTCYFEMSFTSSRFCVALTFKEVTVADEVLFGDNGSSWALYLQDNSFCFRHMAVRTHIPGPVCSRIGVYLDHAAGILRFYDLSDSIRLLHEVRTAFCRPLHLGIMLFEAGVVEICPSTMLK